MKKIIIALMLLTSPAIANDRFGRPIHYYPQYAYNAGYNNGKHDQRIKTEKAIVATALIAIGTIMIYNAITNSNVKSKDITRLSYKF